MQSRALASLVLLSAIMVLFSCALPPSAESQPLRTAVGAYELEVLVDGMPVRTFRHQGETYLLGQEGHRYVLRVHNRSGRRIEAVVSVDGLDVIDGKSADFKKRGYLVSPYGYVDIDGWRLSEQQAAAFRFAAISESYAAKTGRARNVGVIGVAVFPERARPEPVYPPYSYRAPADAEYDLSRDRGGVGSLEGKGSAKRSSAPAPASSGAAAESRAAEASAPAKRERSGLGTEFGEAVSSQIRHVSFERAHASRPASILGARYNDRSGLYALGIEVDGSEPTDLALRESATPFPVSQHRYARPPADWRRD